MTSLPRILFINRIAPHATTGGCMVIWALGDEMARRGWKVHYLFPEGTTPPPPRENTSYHGVHVPGNEYSASYPFLAAGTARLRRLMKDIDPDIVYDNCNPAPFIPAYFFDRPRVVSRIHHLYASAREIVRYKKGLVNSAFTWLGEQWFHTLAPQRVIIDSESGRQRLTTIKSNLAQATIISPGIDLSAIPPPNLDSPRPGKNVVVVTRLAKNKGVDFLLRAWQIVEREDNEATLTIAGTGNDEAKLHSLAQQLELKRANFLGYVSDEDKWRLLNECSLYAFPTLMEGLPIGVLEPMAMGAPIISTLVPGVTDVIAHGESGYLVPSLDSIALGRGILTVLDDPETAHRMAKEARRQVEERDQSRVADQEIAHLVNLLDSGHVHRGR